MVAAFRLNRCVATPLCPRVPGVAHCTTRLILMTCNYRNRSTPSSETQRGALKGGRRPHGCELLAVAMVVKTAESQGLQEGFRPS